MELKNTHELEKRKNLLTEEERLQRVLTHQPFLALCEICQHSKGRPAYHKRENTERQTVITV